MIEHDNLEEFQDPENYDIEEAQHALVRAAFYGDIAALRHASVLEIACGTGLVAIPVARRGLAVTGTDISPAMLEHARRKSVESGLDVDWVEADARSLKLARQFDFVYLTGNAFQAFITRDDQDALLSAVAGHLAPGGCFAFETRNPDGNDLSPQPREQEWFRYTSVQGHEVAVSGTQHFDTTTRLMHWSTFRRWRDGEKSRTRVSRIACRFITCEELDTLLADNGFTVTGRYGDFDGSPFRRQSPSIITLCKRSFQEPVGLRADPLRG
jgi:SAM-dependent methyltransferase